MEEFDNTKCPICKGELIWVEYPWGHPGYWDGCSEVECYKCKKRWGRWSHRELKGNDYEDPNLRFPKSFPNQRKDQLEGMNYGKKKR